MILTFVIIAADFFTQGMHTVFIHNPTKGYSLTTPSPNQKNLHTYTLGITKCSPLSLISTMACLSSGLVTASIASSMLITVLALLSSGHSSSTS